MQVQTLNRVSGKVVLALSVIALLTVLMGYAQPPQADEGALAHIFQLSVVALAAMVLLFFGTADWNQGWRSARPLVVPALALAAAFSALYYLEHVWYR
ncbi:MAG TPA: hypothetical protein VE779_06375 [Candidatus Angelobacter sp.]|jgi:uncharacterized YccA/Bax inhibitor family protein|nr:hypothetical protein [Candidatus Angelobacter sp.]